MRFTEETIMAYADGELDDTTRFEVELAMRQDPALAEKIRQHRLLRSNVFGAFASTLEEEVPQRLQAAVRSGKVVQLDSVRQLRTPQAAPPKRQRPSWSWPEWGALAATLIVGVLAGGIGSQNLGGAQLAALDGGALKAEGKLAAALTQQLAGAAPADAEVRLGVSFVAKDGNFCRSFMLPKMAGLACRSGDDWRIPVMASSAAGAAGDYRQAGSAMPAAVLDAIDERIAGKALDADDEGEARKRGWKR
jgi:negative regulator of sigma E activity